MAQPKPTMRSFGQSLLGQKINQSAFTSRGAVMTAPGMSSPGAFSAIEVAELSSIKKNLNSLLAIEKKYTDLLGDKILRFARTEEKAKLKKKEASQETKGNKDKKEKQNPVVKGAMKGLNGLVGFFGDLFKWFIGYKIVEWVSKPENTKKVKDFAKLFLGIFGFISNVVGFGIDKLMSGLSHLVDGGGITRVFGALEMIVGFFTLKWLLNPTKIISDIKFVGDIFTKVIPNTINGVLNFFTNLIPSVATQAADTAINEGIKGATEAGKQAAKEGATQVTEQATKKGAGAVAKGAGKATAKVTGKSLLKKLPVIGAVAGGAFAVDRASKGDWLGAGMEVASGAASLLPGWGTAASIGIDAALVARDIAKEKEKEDKKLPKLAKGGIVTRPTKAIVGEAGPEAILPLDKLSSFTGRGVESDIGKIIPKFMKMLTIPFTLVGAGIIALMSSSLSVIPGIGPLMMPLIGSIASTFGIPTSIVKGVSKFVKNPAKVLSEGAGNISKLFGDRDPKVTKQQGNKFTPSRDTSVRGLLANILGVLSSKNSETTTPPPTPPSPGPSSPGTPDTGAGGSPAIGGSAKPLPQNANLAKAGDSKVQNVAGTEADLLSKGFRYVPNTANRFWQDSDGRLYEARRTRNNTSLASMAGFGQDVYSLRAVTEDQINKGFTAAGSERTVGSRNNQEIQRQLELFRIINKGGTLEKETTGTQTQTKINGQWQTKSNGGKIGGVGGGDKIPALLEPQEYVLNRNAVRGMGGPGVLDKINFGMFPRFQTGGRVVTSIPFINRNIPGVSSGMHMGADIQANYEALKSYVDGEVIQTSPPAPSAGYGPKWVVWKGSDGRGHMFAHMSQVFVKKGDRLRKGQKIGISGNAGTGPHLHWEVSSNPADVGQDKSSRRSRLNPIDLFGKDAPFGGDIRPGEGSTDIAGLSQSGAEPGASVPEISFAEIAKNLGKLYKGLTGTPTTKPSAPATSPSVPASSSRLQQAQTTSNNYKATQRASMSKPGGNLVSLSQGTNVINQSTFETLAPTLGGTIAPVPLTLFPVTV